MEIKKQLKARGSDNYTQVGRYITEDYLNGHVSLYEMVLFLWFMLRANPYNGKYTISYEALIRELYGLVKHLKPKYRVNFFNKKVLALKRKKYLYFKSRRGSRTAFEITMNNYPLSSKGYTDLGLLLDEGLGRSKEGYNRRTTAELDTKLNNQEQNLPQENCLKNKENNICAEIQSRGTNNKNENNNDINSLASDDASKSMELIPVDEFVPKTEEEQICKDIAIELEDEYINLVLLRFRECDDIKIIEKAFDETEKIDTERCLENKATYFNTVITRMINDRKKI